VSARSICGCHLFSVLGKIVCLCFQTGLVVTNYEYLCNYYYFFFFCNLLSFGKYKKKMFQYATKVFVSILPPDFRDNARKIILIKSSYKIKAC
jgi:hypothetical protein